MKLQAPPFHGSRGASTYVIGTVKRATSSLADREKIIEIE